MNERTAAFRAAVRDARKRRASLALFLGALAILAISATTSYLQLRSQERYLDQVPAARSLSGLPLEYSCDESTCTFRVPGGRRFGDVEVPAEALDFGARFEPGRPGVDDTDPAARAEYAPLRARFVETARAMKQEMEREFAPRRIMIGRLRMAGTMWGVLFAIVFGATFLGAEWRWGVWRTQLTHEPRRGVLFANKLAAAWACVAAGFFAIALVLAVYDALLRSVFHITASGGPDTGTLALESLRALIGVETYASFAIAFTMLLRTGVAGFGIPVVAGLVDGMVTPYWTALRGWLPIQQVAALLPNLSSDFVVSTMWFPRVTDARVCDTAGAVLHRCHNEPLTPIPHWRAVLVLVTWSALSAIVAGLVLRVRDIPD